MYCKQTNRCSNITRRQCINTTITPVPIPVSGLEIETDTVAFATEFFLFATRKMRVVANLRLGFALTVTK